MMNTNEEQSTQNGWSYKREIPSSVYKQRPHAYVFAPRLLRTFSSAATMLLAVLLHLLIFHLLTASEKTVPDAPNPTPTLDPETKLKPRKDTEYKIKFIKHCPKAGYFLKREASANALDPYTCNLCFCQGDHVAICWKRDNRRCDKESFHYHGVAKKREKRSPGFTDIFFRDASRDVFNKNAKTQCKPFESSFSDDCPPADWCTGCTVCDCDANGHWDCHLLSFCPDDNKKSKTHPGQVPPFGIPSMDKTKEKLINTSSLKPTTTRPNAIANKGVIKKKNNKSKPQIQRGGKKKPPPKRFVNKKTAQKSNKTPDPKKMKTPTKYNKVTSKTNSTKNKIIKKNIATHRPIQMKTTNNLNLETEIARKMMRTVMQNLKKTVENKVRSLSEIVRQNENNVRNQKARAKINQMKKKRINVNRRQIKKSPPKKTSKKPSIKKGNTKTLMKTRTPIKKPMYRMKTTKKPSTKQHVRNKRDVAMTEPLGNSADSNTTNTTDSAPILTVIPVQYSNSLVPDDSNSSFALLENTTHSDRTYYKYTVVSEEPSTKLDIKVGDAAPTPFNRTETIINLLDEHVNSTGTTEKTLAPEKRHIKNSDINKIINMTRTKPEENGLKFSQWLNVKIPKDKTYISESNIKQKILTKLMSQTAKTILQEHKNRTNRLKAEKILNYRKYNLLKLIQSKCKFENCKINNSVGIDLPTKSKEMYEQLNNFENKINEKPKVSEVKDLNNSVAIENISRDIINNLRKLKRLAQTVSFRGKETKRTKRAIARDEDAMEYLLMMMEYLIKQNHALDTEPVNDGIDLLIEAIKNAPDIKAIKKKVLDYTPEINLLTTTASAPVTLNTVIVEDTEPVSDDESLSDSDSTDNKTSTSEDNGKIKIEDNERKFKENKEFIDVISEDEKEFDDKFQFDRKVESDKTEEITETAFFRRLGAEENIMHDTENTPETTTNTMMPLEMETINDKIDSKDDFNGERTLAIESNNLDKPFDYSEASGKKTEAFTEDIDDDSFLPSTIISTTETETPTSTLAYYPTQVFQTEKPVTKMIKQKVESSDYNNVDKRARLKWIEENFGKESEKGLIDSEEIKSTLSIIPVTDKTIDKLDHSVVTRDKGDVNDNTNEREVSDEREKQNVRKKDNVRGKAIENDQSKTKRISVEINRSDDEAETKKTQAKLSAEEVMFRKQMELLNSLDYGTEKAEVYEQDSKDSNVDEPNTADSFPSYYV
ncbi:hypothetical protein PYW07_009804 [Mythimna separata]|uniref:Uncharacterized protein n=1 Tax=Mythimna separata TaxID=271217 RepID=A0AAD7YD95_MYTSE|nr:hypothetical protein PYW07_009804 [Mythimna separata]